MGINISLMNRGGAKKIEDIFVRRVKKLMQTASIEFWRQVMKATPVKTGYARFGWFISVKTPSSYLPPAQAQKRKYPMPQLKDHSSISAFGIDDVLYITNNVPYIDHLNDGYSRQAPARFVESAAARVQNVVAAKAKRIK